MVGPGIATAAFSVQPMPGRPFLFRALLATFPAWTGPHLRLSWGFLNCPLASPLFRPLFTPCRSVPLPSHGLCPKHFRAAWASGAAEAPDRAPGARLPPEAQTCRCLGYYIQYSAGCPAAVPSLGPLLPGLGAPLVCCSVRCGPPGPAAATPPRHLQMRAHMHAAAQVLVRTVTLLWRWCETRPAS